MEQKRDIRNESLFSALRQLSRSFLDALDKPFSPDSGSWYERTLTILEGGPDTIAKVLEKRPDLNEEVLSSCLTQAKKCVEHLEGEEKIGKSLPHAGKREDYYRELALFVSRILEERERFQNRNTFPTPAALTKHIEERVLKQEYTWYESYLYDESVTDFIVAPIASLVCEGVLELEGEAKIRKVTRQEFHSLSEAEEKSGTEPLFYPETVAYLPNRDGEWGKQLAKVVTALRLVKKENLGLTSVYLGYANPCRNWDISRPPSGTRALEGAYQRVGTLSEEDSAELRELASRIEKTKGTKYLELSMRRFNLAHERQAIEDRWIDYFVSLESLFSKGEEITEVGHRLAIRIAKAIATGFDEKRKLRKNVKDWYKKRSQIVHGLEVRFPPEDVEGLEGLVRDSIKWFLRNNEFEDHDKIIDELDLG